MCGVVEKKEVVETKTIKEIKEVDEIEEVEEVVNVLPTVTRKKVVKKVFTCSPYLSGIIRLGKRNNINEVAKLEKFLNEFEGENLPVNGTYSSADRDAVIRMQKKYSKDGKALGHNTAAFDGVVGPKTRLKINELYCIAKSKEKLKAEKNSL